MLKKHNKYKKLYIAGSILLLVIAFFLATFFGAFERDGKKFGLITNMFTDKNGTEGEETGTYRRETTWDGTGTVSDKVYEYTFDKGYGNYVSNVKYSEDLQGKLEVVTKENEGAVKAFIQAAFGKGYREIAGNREVYIKNLVACIDDYFQDMKAEDYANALADWIIENRYQAEVSIVTDHSLVWTDAYSYIRAEVTFSVYQCEGGDLPWELFPDNFNPTQDGTYIMDFQLLFNAETRKNNVRRIECLDSYEGIE